MQLAYSTNAFTQYNLITAISKIAELGYNGVEILCEKPHWYPDDVGQKNIDVVADTLAEFNLKVSNLNANTANSYFNPAPPENVFEPSLSNKIASVRKAREDIVIKALKLAHKINAPCISLTSGQPTPGCLPEKATDYFVESLKKICDYAHQYGVRVGIEYEPGLIVERATEVIDVIDRVGSDLLGVNLDIGHSYLSNEPPEETINSLAGRIWNVHIEDIKNMKHFHLPPGDGDMPFDRYINSFKKIDYQGFLTVELYSFPDQPMEVGKQSIDYLKQLV